MTFLQRTCRNGRKAARAHTHTHSAPRALYTFHLHGLVQTTRSPALPCACLRAGSHGVGVRMHAHRRMGRGGDTGRIVQARAQAREGGGGGGGSYRAGCAHARGTRRRDPRSVRRRVGRSVGATECVRAYVRAGAWSCGADCAGLCGGAWGVAGGYGAGVRMHRHSHVGNGMGLARAQARGARRIYGAGCTGACTGEGS